MYFLLHVQQIYKANQNCVVSSADERRWQWQHFHGHGQHELLWYHRILTSPFIKQNPESLYIQKVIIRQTYVPYLSTYLPSLRHLYVALKAKRVAKTKTQTLSLSVVGSIYTQSMTLSLGKALKRATQGNCQQVTLSHLLQTQKHWRTHKPRGSTKKQQNVI